jgi:uncharacterized membrane protein YfcA
LIASLVVALASALAVVSGFGFVLFSAPLLSLFYDPTHVVIVTIAMSTLLLGVLFLTTNIHQVMDSRLAFTLVLSSILGMPLGVWLLPWMDKAAFRILLGTITLLFVLSRAVGWHLHLPNSKFGVVLTGALGGVFSASTGLSSLPIIWLLGSRNLTPLSYRATLATYVFLNGVLSLIALALNGSLPIFDTWQFVSLSPALVVGLVSGIFLVRKLSQDQLERGSLIYLGVIGLLTAVFIRT